ncbi:hypothetical protein [Yoonia sediminilitoris]|uniref:CHRD domain-containing protein n=1 Tax=Yoonia sediminilitoris TaxID=1286148 RepID=A0A2T6K7N9_9RHOB|nr:hypothetical protein [Yoonia sediminilitoris]PUB10730.1 hypothetical protein C8N45_11775 [Yoonia sediminilitoris]RCW90482.1 hypothetical protein DFP92_11775 [Yoonia sediminilitoris]
MMIYFLPRLLGGWIILPLFLFASAAHADAKETQGWTDGIDFIAKRGVTIVETNEGPALIVLETAFDTDPTAQLLLRLGRDGQPDQRAHLGQLSMTKGLQVFEVPGQIDLNAFNEIHIINGRDGRHIGVAEIR